MSLGAYTLRHRAATTQEAPGAVRKTVGWRSWVWDENAARLSSVYGAATPWTPGEPYRAVCEASRYIRESLPEHSSPDRSSCQCGIRAYKKAGDVPLFSGEITGSCELWGTVLEHEHGYRASHASPLELVVQTDGASDGDERAASIARQLGQTYGVPVQVLSYEEADELLARILRDTPAKRGLARVSRIAWTARELLDSGDPAGAVETVLGELRRLDLREIDPGGQMGQGLPGPLFLHERETRRWVRTVEGEPGAQRLTILSLKGQAPLYHGPQYVDLDTRTGGIVERIEECAGPRHRGHSVGKGHPADEEITITRIGAGLRLETWIQVLYWASDPYILAGAAILRTQRPTLGYVYPATALLRRPRKIRIGKWPE